MSNEEKENLIEQPLDLTDEETLKKVKDQIADEVIAENGLSPEEAEAYKRMLEEATMPVELTDSKFTLGANELDIRSLNKKNLNQMFFRTLVLHSVYLKNITTSLIDLTRLFMICLDKLGVENIVQATDDIIEKIKEQNNKTNNKPEA